MGDRQEELGRFGRNLRRARLGAGLSQKELAGRAGISRSYVGKLEAGGSECRFLTATRLADGLGIGIDELFEGNPAGPPRPVRTGPGSEGADDGRRCRMSRSRRGRSA